MDRAPASLNCFAGLSRTLDRTSERRNDAAWIAARAHTARARYLLLDATGEAFLQRDHAALRLLDDGERERLLGAVKPSFLGIMDDHPWFLLVLDAADDDEELCSTLHARRV